MTTMITMCYGKVREQLCSWFKNKNKETRHKQLSPVVMKSDILLAHPSTQTSSIHRLCRSVTTSLDFLLCFLQNQLICLRSLLLKYNHMSFFLGTPWNNSVISLGRTIPRKGTHEDLIFDWILLCIAIELVSPSLVLVSTSLVLLCLQIKHHGVAGRATLWH